MSGCAVRVAMVRWVFAQDGASLRPRIDDSYDRQVFLCMFVSQKATSVMPLVKNVLPYRGQLRAVRLLGK